MIVSTENSIKKKNLITRIGGELVNLLVLANNKYFSQIEKKYIQLSQQSQQPQVNNDELYNTNSNQLTVPKSIAIMVLDLNYNSYANQPDTFKQSFEIDMASALNVGVNAVNIIAVESGSVEVVFSLESTIADNLLDDLKNNIIKKPTFLNLREMLGYNNINIVSIRKQTITRQEYLDELSNAASSPAIDVTDTYDEIEEKSRIKECCNEEKISDTVTICKTPNIYNRIYNQIPRASATFCRGFPIFKNKENEAKWYSEREPRVQRGRWNTSITNTKLFPIISRGFEYGSKSDLSNNIQDRSFDNTIPTKQSKNLFKNTTYNMSKRELISYLSRNHIIR